MYIANGTKQATKTLISVENTEIVYRQGDLHLARGPAQGANQHCLAWVATGSWGAGVGNRNLSTLPGLIQRRQSTEIRHSEEI